MAVGGGVGHSNLALSLLVSGVMAGALYGLIGMTLTLMFRSSGVLSFAHAGFSLMAAYMYAGFACPLPKGGAQCSAHPTMAPWQALVVCIVSTTVVGLIVERFVMRPLEGAPVVTKLVATAAVLSLIAGILLEVYGPNPRVTPQKQQLVPSGGFSVGSTHILWDQATIFVAAVVLVALLGLYLRRSWFGLAIRASGQRAEVAQLLGVTPARVSRFNWALGAALSGLAGVLLAPIEVVNVTTFGFLTVKSVGAMVLGGLVSLPLTFVGGLFVGVVEYVTPDFWHAQGSSEMLTALILALALALYRKRIANLTAFAVAQGKVGGRRAVGRAIAGVLDPVVQAARRLPGWMAIIPVIALCLIPLQSTYYGAIGVNSIYFGLLALSMVVVTGITGQVSFVQAGFVGIGAFVMFSGVYRHWSLLTAGLVALVVCGVLGWLIGLVSLRYKGAEFIILTLAFSAAASDFALETKTLDHPLLQSTSTLGLNLVDEKRLYLFCLFFAALCVLAVVNIGRSGWGRSMRAMADLEGRIGHFGLPPVRSASSLLAVSGVIAGLAGCVLGLSLTSLDTSEFTPILSLTVVLVAVVGGVRTVWGALFAALVFGPGQQIIANRVSSTSANAFPQIASAVLALLIVVYAPNGIAGLGRWARELAADSPAEESWWWRGPLASWVGRLGEEEVPDLEALGAERLASGPRTGSELGRRWAPLVPNSPIGIGGRALAEARNGAKPADQEVGPTAGRPVGDFTNGKDPTPAGLGGRQLGRTE